MTPLRSLIEKILDELFETDAVYDMDSNAKRNLKIIYYTKFQQAITEFIDDQPSFPNCICTGNQPCTENGYHDGAKAFKSNLMKGVKE